MWGQGQGSTLYSPDQAMTASGGMGMSMLQKMGWKPGEGLGRRSEGTLEPLKIAYKKNKRGLACAEEFLQPRSPNSPKSGQPLEGKHPVSFLTEYCTRRHLDPPMFTIISEEGPPHKKSFILKVNVNGIDYQPESPSPTKKTARTEAAILCLRDLGFLPPA